MIWAWIKAHAAVLVLSSVAMLLILLWVMGLIKGPNPAEAIDDKVEIIKTRHQVFRLTKLKGIEEATRHVEEKYAQDVAKMDELDRAKAAALARDPVALVDFIVTTNRKLRAQ